MEGMVIHAGYATGSQGLSKLQCWKTSCSVCATGSQCKLKWWKSRSWAVYKLSEVQVQMVLLCVSYPSYATVLCISYTVPEVQVQMVLLCVRYPLLDPLECLLVLLPSLPLTPLLNHYSEIMI